MKEGSALSVTVLCVGKLRERFYADAAQEYLKRLSRLMPTEVVEGRWGCIPPSRPGLISS